MLPNLTITIEILNFPLYPYNEQYNVSNSTAIMTFDKVLLNSEILNPTDVTKFNFFKRALKK